MRNVTKRRIATLMTSVVMTIGGLAFVAPKAQATDLGMGCSGDIVTNGSYYNWRTNCTSYTHRSHVVWNWSTGSYSNGNWASPNSYSNLYWYTGWPVSTDVQI
jgi:hypothetical protein